MLRILQDEKVKEVTIQCNKLEYNQHVWLTSEIRIELSRLNKLLHARLLKMNQQHTALVPLNLSELLFWALLKHQVLPTELNGMSSD